MKYLRNSKHFWKSFQKVEEAIKIFLEKFLASFMKIIFGQISSW